VTARLVSALIFLAGGTALAEDRIVQGQLARPWQFREVLPLHVAGNSSPAGFNCTATVIGPRVVVFAAHCLRGATEGDVIFRRRARRVKVLRSPKWATEYHDLAVGIAGRRFEWLRPATVGGTAKNGDSLTMAGYGCAEWQKPPDGRLRYGTAKVLAVPWEYSDYMAELQGGAASCSGDSGGPSFLRRGHRRLLYSVTSGGAPGNFKSYVARLDHPESRKFLSDVARTERVGICGVNLHCP
jgi:hypothetical protein